MKGAKQIAKRLFQSAVVWSWTFNGLRLASGLLLLPLLLHVLSDADLGMYFVFLSLAALIPVVDSSVSVTVGRLVAYAMAGATQLKPQGIHLSEGGAGPNSELLWQLLS